MIVNFDDEDDDDDDDDDLIDEDKLVWQKGFWSAVMFCALMILHVSCL